MMSTATAVPPKIQPLIHLGRKKPQNGAPKITFPEAVETNNIVERGYGLHYVVHCETGYVLISRWEKTFSKNRRFKYKGYGKISSDSRTGRIPKHLREPTEEGYEPNHPWMCRDADDEEYHFVVDPFLAGKNICLILTEEQYEEIKTHPENLTKIHRALKEGSGME